MSDALHVLHSLASRIGPPVEAAARYLLGYTLVGRFDTYIVHRSKIAAGMSYASEALWWKRLEMRMVERERVMVRWLTRRLRSPVRVM